MTEDLKAEAYAALAGPATREARLEEALKEIEAMLPVVLQMIRAKNYVFIKLLSKKPETEAERWEALAFYLYTNMTEANLIARNALGDEDQHV